MNRFVLALAAASMAACGGSNGNTSDGGGSPDGGADSGGSDGNGGAMDGVGSTDSDSGNGGTDHDGGGSTDSDSGNGAGFACTTGKLFAGNPLYNTPTDRPAEGTGILQDPPFLYRTVVFSNGQMITHDGQEIWRASLSDGILHKVAGTESVQEALITGACAGARFGNIFGIALASDGSLYVSDQTANAILQITDPLGANCTVHHIAGTPTDQPEGSFTPEAPPNVGSDDGPGDSAKFGLPERMAIDPAGNVYVWDGGNDSIRKIANDSAHTVSTLLTSASGGSGGGLFEVFLGGNLYIWGKKSNEMFLTALDPVSRGTHLLFLGRADLFGGNSSDAQSWGGIVTDGTGLILQFNGQLFYVDTDGTIHLPALAGTYHPGLEYSTGYDPTTPHAAADLEIPEVSQFATAGAYNWLTMDAQHHLFVSGSVKDSYVLEVLCGP